MGSSISKTEFKFPCEVTTTGQGHCRRLDDNVYEPDKVDFIFGEMKIDGVSKALGKSRLNAAAATTLNDLGMGCGKLLLQVPNQT